MNNEPVAWMDKETECFVYNQCDYENLDEYEKDGLIPLYTHPAKEQDESFDRTASHMAGEYASYPSDLTDEEISNIRDQFFAPNGCNIYTFARALLKKAQNND